MEYNCEHYLLSKGYLKIMGIKRPFSSRMLMSGYDLGAEPIADVMNPPWKYVNRINESGYEVRTLYHYNNTYGGEEVTVPYGYTELQDFQTSTRPYNIYNANLPFYNRQCLVSIDLNNVPFRNNSMCNAFYRCINLINVTNISNSVTNMASTFCACENFNQPIIIPNSVTCMHHTFGNCPNFNQPVAIPNSVTDMASTFSWCHRFNQSITIPSSVTNMSRLFHYCNKIGGEGIAINILSTEITNVINAFYGCAYNLRRNVYTYFTYANGENTKTYNSLASAGYTTAGKGNTYLMDLGPAPW